MSKSEYKFMGEIQAKLKAVNGTVVRIETGATALGVPDMYVMLPVTAHIPGEVIWIETKKVHASIGDLMLSGADLSVPWSSQQTGFADKYRMAAVRRVRDATVVRYTWTFVEGDDGVVMIPVYKQWPDCKVNLTDPAVLWYPRDRWSKLSGVELYELMVANSALIYPTHYVDDKLKDVVLRMVHEYMRVLFEKSSHRFIGLTDYVLAMLRRELKVRTMSKVVDKQWLTDNEHRLTTSIRNHVAGFFVEDGRLCWRVGAPDEGGALSDGCNIVN